MVLELWAFVGVRMGVAACWNKLALCKNPKNLNARSQHFSFYSLPDLSVHTDVQAGGKTNESSSTRAVVPIKNISLWTAVQSYAI